MRARIELDRHYNENSLVIVAWCYDENRRVIMRRFYERKKPAEMTQFQRDTVEQVKNELKAIGYEVTECKK